MSIKGFKLTDNSVEQYDYNYLDNIPETDTTLSIAGAAADSKIVGDKFNHLLYKAVNEIDISLFEKGSVSQGQDDSYFSVSRIRTPILYALSDIYIKSKTNSPALFSTAFFNNKG